MKKRLMVLLFISLTILCLGFSCATVPYKVDIDKNSRLAEGLSFDPNCSKRAGSYLVGIDVSNNTKEVVDIPIDSFLIIPETTEAKINLAQYPPPIYSLETGLSIAQEIRDRRIYLKPQSRSVLSYEIHGNLQERLLVMLNFAKKFGSASFRCSHP